MVIIKPFLLFFLFLSILGLSSGCATLPNVSEMIDEAPTDQPPDQIVSSKGLLSPQKSEAIMERLKRSVDPTDILERHTAVVESVTESPLTKGNKVTLLFFDTWQKQEGRELSGRKYFPDLKEVGNTREWFALIFSRWM